jgi:hypothetical protein
MAGNAQGWHISYVNTLPMVKIIQRIIVSWLDVIASSKVMIQIERGFVHPLPNNIVFRPM